jgi:hypothetical protein
MLNKIFPLFISFLLVGINAFAQAIISFEYVAHYVVPYAFKVDGSKVGGLSGVIYNDRDGLFYTVADKPPARIYKANIAYNDSLSVDFDKVLYLRPQLLSQAELEGIVINKKSNNFYVADEQSIGTRLLELDSTAGFVKIIQPVNQPFLPLSGHNSGIEGLALIDDLKYLYYAYERPTAECLNQSLVNITRLDLSSTLAQDTYFYKLHPVAGDEINTNGISDLLLLNDTTLMVLERAYIPGKGNVVRLYQADLSQAANKKTVNCDDEAAIPLRSTLLFDFAKVDELDIDNAEGMTFNADRSLLILITDNNFSKTQQTQIIILQADWQ